MDISGLVVGGSPRFIAVYPVKRKILVTRMETQKKTLWEYHRTTNIVLTGFKSMNPDPSVCPSSAPTHIICFLSIVENNQFPHSYKKIPINFIYRLSP